MEYLRALSSKIGGYFQPTNYTPGKEAGEAFEKAAQVQKQHLNEPDDEANTLTEAFSTLDYLAERSHVGLTRNRGLPQRRP